MKKIRCPKCKGNGYIVFYPWKNPGISIGIIDDQADCNKEKCPKCKGKGYIKKLKR